MADPEENKRRQDLAGAIRQALEQADGSNLAIEKLVDIAKTYGEKTQSARVAAIRILLAYGYGLPPEQKELTGKIETTIRAEDLSDDELAAIASGVVVSSEAV